MGVRQRIEIWKNIKDYEGKYQISNMGRVKSIQRKCPTHWASRIVPGRILKLQFNHDGYRHICLCKNGKRKTKKVCWLVWDAFGNKKRDGRKLQIDHINNNRADDRIENLQLLLHRENVSKGKLRFKNKGRYSGVNWSIDKGKWGITIVLNKKSKFLGYYQNEFYGHLIYQTTLVRFNRNHGRTFA